MLDVLIPQRHAVAIDLASVRDTLLYIESDLGQSPDLNQLASAIRSALCEIDRLQNAAEVQGPDFGGARFLPAQF